MIVIVCGGGGGNGAHHQFYLINSCFPLKFTQLTAMFLGRQRVNQTWCVFARRNKMKWTRKQIALSHIFINNAFLDFYFILDRLMLIHLRSLFYSLSLILLSRCTFIYWIFFLVSESGTLSLSLSHAHVNNIHQSIFFCWYLFIRFTFIVRQILENQQVAEFAINF